MLDESEFKPFTLTDFSVEEVSPVISSGSVSEHENGEEDTEENEIATRLASFKPLTFDVDGDSEKYLTENSAVDASGKTDVEKIQLSKGFKNAEFFQENSLLTNAENFAESIRDGAKLYKSQLLTKIEEQASDTERIYQQTVTENQEAELKRKDLLSSTEEKVEKIKRDAFQEGLESGLQQGIQQRYDEAEPLILQVNTVLEQLNSLRQVVRFQAEEELVKLALKIAKNVVVEELKLNDSVIQNIVQNALHETEIQGKVYVYLHPDDYKFLLNCKSDLEHYLNDEQTLVLRQNPEMEPGSIYVESEEEIISRTIDGQFEKLEESLTDQMENRHAHLTEVDIDAHDFSLKTIDPASLSTEPLDLTRSENNENEEQANADDLNKIADVENHEIISAHEPEIDTTESVESAELVESAESEKNELDTKPAEIETPLAETDTDKAEE